MAVGDSKVYGAYATNILNGTNLVDWDADTIKVALLTNSYTPAPDTDNFWDDVSTYEISDAGYTAGGDTLTTVSVAYDSTNDRGEVACDDPSWTFSGTVTPAWAVCWKDTTTPSTSPLICYWELADVGVSGDYSLVVDAEGIFQARATAQTA